MNILAILSTFTTPELIAGAVGILLVAISLLGWFKLIIGVPDISADEQAKIDADQVAYLKRHKIRIPK